MIIMVITCLKKLIRVKNFALHQLDNYYYLNQTRILLLIIGLVLLSILKIHLIQIITNQLYIFQTQLAALTVQYKVFMKMQMAQDPREEDFYHSVHLVVIVVDQL